MSKFTSLIDEVADEKGCPLSSVLLKAKVLASRIRSTKFKQWVEREINGYEVDFDIPDYRILVTPLTGHFAGTWHTQLRNVPISVNHLPNDMQVAFSQLKMREGISHVESLINSGSNSLGMDMDGFAVNYLRQNGPYIDGMVLNGVHKRVSIPSLAGLVASARARLLDFLLDLREKYPDLDKSDETIPPTTAIDESFDRTIFSNCSFHGNPHMGDNYQAGQAGAMGPHAHAEKMTFIQTLRDAIGGNSLGELATELERLRLAILGESKSADQDAAVASVAEAETAAKKGDSSGVLSFLGKAGAWALDVATRIGVPVATKALEGAIKSASQP